MQRRIRAVYKEGILHPLDPLQLDDMQEVTLTLNDKSTIDDDLAGYFNADEWSAASNDTVTWNDVQTIFTGIDGSLSAAAAAQR
jgi:predicted DNA-binding antitoxin AbrB/MazE fold protein